ncbi:enterochelin esterase [Streptomyces sp. cmx-18-6]|uniref:enterochelin esterase n=1 Tax=Streptomyces sp. cmx-18-6 TaxID=2790930 RepID=UPI00397EA968
MTSDCTEAPDAVPRPVTGPRVARLAQQLEAAPDAAARDALTEAFWAEVEATGAPLVEELDDAPGHRAVTFLWRGHRATRRVLLMAPGITDRDRLADALLHRLPGTDVWHLGRRLRADHRGSYRLVADISPGSAPVDPALLQRRLLALRAHGGADPLNPDRIPARWRTAQGSVFALPDAPPQPWTTARPTGVPRGGVERHTLAAGALGVERDVLVYLPPDAAPSESADAPSRPADVMPHRAAHEPGERGRLPLLVLCDGDMWFGRLGLQDTLDALIADGVLPPLAVLAPDAVDSATRWRELGGREGYVSFLADEAVPWAQARWPLTARADRTVVAGQGLGGMTALYAGLTRPERFGRVLAQSPALWWRPGLEPGAPAPDEIGTPWLATLAAGLRDKLPDGEGTRRGEGGRSGERGRSAERGRRGEGGQHAEHIKHAEHIEHTQHAEHTEHIKHAEHSQPGRRGAVVHLDVGLHEGPLVEHSEALSAVLRARGHQVARTVHNGGHDYACWRGSLADALVELLGAHLDVDAAESQGGTGLPRHAAGCSSGLPAGPAVR